MQMRPEEVEELWGDFRDVVAAMDQDPAVVSKMETKLKRGFLAAATRSCEALMSWLNQVIKAGRLSLQHVSSHGKPLVDGRGGRGAHADPLDG